MEPHTAEQDAPEGLGEPRPDQGAAPERRGQARQLVHQEQCVLSPSCNTFLILTTRVSAERVLLARICTLLAPHQPKTPAPTASNPNPLPPIHRRLPANSPAISHGTLDEAVKGGGPLGAMFGGGQSAEEEAAIEKAQKDREEEEKRKKEQMLKMMKPKKMHIKRRR